MDAVKGLVVLILSLAGVGGIAIAILAWKLDQAKKENARLMLELAKAKRGEKDRADKERIDGLSDDELADSARSAFRDL